VAAIRPYWKGFLKLSFVSCPIALYPATSAAERLSFRQVNRRTGHRLRHQLVDSVTGEAVAPAEKARGYEVGERDFLLVEDRDIQEARASHPAPGAVEIAAPPKRQSPSISPSVVEEPDEPAAPEELTPPVIARPENPHTIEIERFVPAGQLDARYYEKPYFIVPREPVGQEAFAVIRDALRAKHVVGLGRVILSSRERPILIAPMGNGLCGVTLRFAHEVRGEADVFEDIPVLRLPREMVKLAEHIIETKKADFDPAMLEDHYRDALVQILREKHGKRRTKAPRPAAPSHENVVNLMDALRRSIAAERPKPVPRRDASIPKPPPAKRSSARARKAG
jgi:DNA end-binding protein Ku